MSLYRLFEILYNAGFRTVSGKDEHGRSPIHSSQPFWDTTLVDWFYKKGVPFAEVEEFSTFKGIPNTNPNVHWLILRISNSLYSDIESWLHGPREDQCNTFDHDSIEALGVILSGEFAHCVDECKCSCSSAGCDPVAILLKKFPQRPGYNYYPGYHMALLLKSAQYFLVTLEGTPDWNKAGPISRSFVRFSLCEILGLQHVCCNAYIGYAATDFTPRFSEEDFDDLRSKAI